MNSYQEGTLTRGAATPLTSGGKRHAGEGSRTRAVGLLCMEESAWMTGQVLFVDGGASVMDTIFPLDIQQAVAEAAEAA